MSDPTTQPTSGQPIPPPPPAPPPPVSAPTTGQRATRWIQIATAAVLLIVLALVAVSNYLTKDDLPACDSREAKDALSDIFKSKNVEAKSYNEIKTISSSKEEVTCVATLTMANDSILEIDYRLYFEDKTKKVQITAARDKPKP